MQPRMGRVKSLKVFINDIDAYTSKYIAKFMCERDVGAPVDPDSEMEAEEEGRKPTIALRVVGSVSDKSDEDRPYVLEEYLGLSREELIAKLMECDVVIYNISQHTDQVEDALWAVSALHKKIEEFSARKMFILISSVMTWACSKPFDPDDLELPFTDEIFWRRKAHPNFKQHIDLEKKVVKLGKTDRKLFTTYVVASGLQYGMGEQVFHYFFKTSWLGQELETPVFGDGNNIVPTIHIKDLASVIRKVIQRQPKPYYLIAVDSSNDTMEAIVKTVASVLGPGKIKKKPFEEAFLTQDLSMMEIDSMQVNLKMEGVYIKQLFSINWLCESGMVDNIELVVEEYRQCRGLLPIRLCVLGPPAVGKSTVSKLICERYKVHHVTLKETLSETITHLEDVVKDGMDAGSESDNSAVQAQELLNSLNESMEQNEGVLDDQLLVKVVKDKLMSYPCRNQGFVLEGLPETYEQAKGLFSAEEQESEDATYHISSYIKRIMPEFVLCLDASDAFLTDRLINMPEKLVQEHNYEQDHVLQRLAKYRESCALEETVVNCFDELDIPSLCLEITSSEKPDCLRLMQRIYDTVGGQRNYGPSSQGSEEERIMVEEKMRRESQEKAQEEQKEVEEARLRAARWEEWTRGLEQARQQEEEQLEVHSVPIRNYLIEHVMPTLTQGLMECCMARPPDPVDFLAEYLFKNNPFDC